MPATKYSLAPAERETTIRWDAETKKATVYTCDLVYIKRLQKLAAECPEVYKLVKEDTFLGNVGVTYEIPAKYISFRKPVQRNYTEEQRQAMAERARNHLVKSRAEET